MATVTKRKPRAATAVVPATTIPAIKGMNPDLTCKGFKFEPGQSYEIEGKIIACQNGFHSCPLDDNSPQIGRAHV